ncbi:MAG: hypothetical protein F6K04_27445 [Leptolyngbya sp. SIO4C5]|uniref:hypothetical protein n=1 Tax=Sphaerothrix gracilis TaxID=3151835 RepID=UPI0013BFC512|nr:hypothetical protein [Leptolyngbya sp. SIO4C5]
MTFLRSEPNRCRIGKVVKSSSHCDYVVQLDDSLEVDTPPTDADYGFGQFVKLEGHQRHWAVGVIYNSQLFNPMFLNSGPRLSSEPDPIFTPDLINDTRTLLGVALVGVFSEGDRPYGIHGIPRAVVPINTAVYRMDLREVHQFHQTAEGKSQFCYYSHLLRSGGNFAAQLTQQVLSELIESDLFAGADRRALEVLCKELSWKNTMGAMR